MSGPSSSALVGIYTHPNGVQEMVETFDQNQYQLQAELLRHGALNWVTRGVYFGEQRNYVEMDIDDTFTPDDAWDSVDPTRRLHQLRRRAAHRTSATSTTPQNGRGSNDFRMDQLFNGGSSVVYQADIQRAIRRRSAAGRVPEAGPRDGQAHADDFGWLSHTYDTPVMDVGCATQNYIEAELNENTSWAAAAPGRSPAPAASA